MAEEGQKLLPCPFCGGEAERVDVPAEADYDDNAGASFIQCRRCVASTGLHYEFKENLVSSWNDRAKPLPAVERTIANEALRRAVEQLFELGAPQAAAALSALIKEPGHE